MSIRHVAAALFAAALLVPAQPATAATWSVVATPNLTAATNRLAGVDSGWAVGSAGTGTVTQRWNGTAWSVVPTPAVAQPAALRGVDGSADNNVWAVGSAGAGTLTQRWNGTAWTVVPSPNPPGSTDATLRAAQAVSATTAWAVGDATVGSVRRTHVVRWNGSAWSAVPSPSPDPTQNFLVAVGGTASDAWAAGNIGHDGYGGGTVIGMLLRWNGTAWTRVAIPGFDSTFSIITFHDLLVLGGDVWVVGEAFHRGQLRIVPYVLRWNGSTWQHGTIPNAPSGAFHGIAALSPTAVYAVGRKDGSGTFVARWNGSAWSQESTPAAGVSNVLADVTATGGTLWAVGTRYDSTWTGRTLALRGS